MEDTLMRIAYIMLIIGLLAGSAFAGCAADAYRKSCASCQFDQNGKMEESCYQGYKASGISCTSAAHPIASAAYAQGKCPGIEACASELGSCNAQVSSGTDKATCEEGSANTCYAAADICVDQAARECGEKATECKAPESFILLTLLGAFFYRRN